MPGTRRSECENMVYCRTMYDLWIDNSQCVPAIIFGKFTDIFVSYNYPRQDFVDTETYITSIWCLEIGSGNDIVLSILEAIPITFWKKLPIIICKILRLII